MRKIEYAITTLLGAGFFPKAPGTFASLVAFAPIPFISDELRLPILLPLAVITSFASIPLISQVEREEGNDPSIVVIDEAVGVWLVFCSPIIPIDVLTAVCGIALFRLFDILKPSIIGKINNKQGAAYVILDDVLAAVASSVLLHLMYFIAKFIGIMNWVINFS